MTAVVAPPAADEPAPASPDGAGVPPAAGGVVVGSGARARHRRRVVLLVLAAVAVGLALRVAISLTDDAPSTDETAYLRSGIALVDGEGFTRGGRPELHFPPFVPFLLGLGSKVFADAHTGTVVLTCVASTAIIVPLALLARRIAGATAAVATAWVAALAPGLSTTVVNRGAGSEAVYMLLVVGSLWLVVSGLDRAGAARLARLAAAGALVGLAYLTRPEGLFVALPLGLAVLVVAVRRPAGGRARRLRAALVPAAAFGVPIVACVVPYAAYLHAHTGTWELSAKTQDASIAAWHAVAQSHREERDSILWALDGTGLHFDTERTSLPALARDDPRGYMGIVGTNVATLAEEVTGPETGATLMWLLLPLPVWVLAAWGAWRWRRSGVARLVLAVAALPVITGLVFFVQPRYLFLLVALATVFAGAAVAALAPWWRRVVVAGAVGLLVLSSVQGFRSVGAGWWHPSDSTDQRVAGEWIAAHAGPDDRVMTRSMVVEYYDERPSMAIPYADLDHILTYGRYYGARYLVVDWYTAVRLRPQLEILRTVDEVPGLRLVHQLRSEGRTTRIFELDPAPLPGRPPGPSLGFVGDG
jgi:hypothetical protein